VSAYDVHDGRRLWTTTRPTDDAAVVVDETAVLLVGFKASRDAVASVSWIDLRTGATRATLEDGVLVLADRTVERRIGDRVEMYDRATSRLVAEVDVDELHTGGAPVRAVPTQRGTVVATAAAAWLIGDDGEVRSSVELPSAPSLPAIEGGRFFAVDGFDGTGDHVLIQGPRSLTMLAADGEELRVRWQRSAYQVDALVSDQHALLAVIPLPDDPLDDSTMAGQLPLEIVSADDGVAMWAGHLPDAMDPVLTASGFIGAPASSTDVSGPGSPIEAYRLDGRRLWTLDARDAATTTVIADALVLHRINASDASATFTLLA